METKNFSALIGAGIVAATLGVTAQSADAFVITNTSATWDNVLQRDGTIVGSDGVAASDENLIKFLDVDGVSQVRWGKAAYGNRAYGWSDYYSNNNDWYYGDYINYDGNKASGYYVKDENVAKTYANQSGLGYQGVSDLNLEVDQVFNIGSLFHYNQALWKSDLTGSSAEFSLDLDFGDSSIGSQSFDFTFTVDETTNSLAECPYYTNDSGKCSDKITWDFAIDEQHTFEHENETYSLELVGFGTELAGRGIVNNFISQENGDNSASLFAKIVKVDTTEEIPEPASLLGLAAFGMYFASSRKKKMAAEQAA